MHTPRISPAIAFVRSPTKGIAVLAASDLSSGEELVIEDTPLLLDMRVLGGAKLGVAAAIVEDELRRFAAASTGDGDNSVVDSEIILLEPLGFFLLPISQQEEFLALSALLTTEI